MNVPYNNGKICIGKYYQKPAYIEQDSDMLLIQKYLISDPALFKRQFWTNFAYRAMLVFALAVVVLSQLQ